MPGPISGAVSSRQMWDTTNPSHFLAYVRDDGPKDGENWRLWAAKRCLFFAGGVVCGRPLKTAWADQGVLERRLPIVEVIHQLEDPVFCGADLDAKDDLLDMRGFGLRASPVPDRVGEVLPDPFFPLCA